MCERTWILHDCGHKIFHSRISCQTKLTNKDLLIPPMIVGTYCNFYAEEVELLDGEECEDCSQARLIEEVLKWELKTPVQVVVQEI
ncbi:hypothetical protein TWF694_003298 [Orbilia ellipsospora]|uniref:Uncharacterized protein n=1 Tax=Orbilia ellipsospora TaxID=2528407 RepID=A0AAV9X166_9PEZI